MLTLMISDELHKTRISINNHCWQYPICVHSYDRLRMHFSYIKDSNYPPMNVIWPFFYQCIMKRLGISTICCKYMHAHTNNIIFQQNLLLTFYQSIGSHYKRMCIVGGTNQNINKEYVLELLKYNNKRDLFEQLQIWSPPRFPINGNMLHLHGCSRGKMMGQVMNQLKDIWAKGNFEMTADDLLKELPVLLKETKESSDGFPTKKPKIN